MSFGDRKMRQRDLTQQIIVCDEAGSLSGKTLLVRSQASTARRLTALGYERTNKGRSGNFVF
jgi:hypothetical protein